MFCVGLDTPQCISTLQLPSCKSDYNTWLHLRGVPSIPSLTAGSTHTVAVVGDIREAELVPHVKMVFAVICMLRAGARLDNNGYFIWNNHIYLVSPRFSSPLIKPDSATSCCSLIVSHVSAGQHWNEWNHNFQVSRSQSPFDPGRIQEELWFFLQCYFFLQWIWDCSFLDISKLLLFYFATVGASVTHHVWQWLPCHPSEVSGTRLLGALDRVIFWFGIVITSLKLHCWKELILLDTQCWAFAILWNHILGHINKIYD